MTDREYLELAAKAAGIDVRWYQGDCLRVADKCNGFAGKWNPLTDSGQALELAVKLRMVVDTDYNGGANAGNAAVDFGEPEYGYQEGQGKTDPFAATRRAVVRAAAEIGRSMK